MAVRFRNDRQKWQAYWNDPVTGKRKSRLFSTKKEAVEACAEAILAKRDETIPTVRKPKGSAPSTVPGITFDEVFIRYAIEKQFNKKALGTKRAQLLYPLAKLGSVSMISITTEDLEAIKQHYMADRSVMPGTVHTWLSSLRAVMNWASEKGYCERVKFPRIPAAQYQNFVPPSSEELQRIIKAAPPHIQRVIILGAQLGVRVGQSELFQLRWSDVDLERRLLRVHGSKKNMNALVREVPIRDSLVKVFEFWRAEDARSGCEFLIHFRGQPIVSIKTSWCNTLRRAGIQRRIRPYDLRHAFGTEMVAAGVDYNTVAKLMGHSNPVMLLMHYAYVMDKQKRTAVERLPDVSSLALNVP